ncbi:MAG: transposase [Firmicutes bacterium]|nr:transposase [Bacillota bacterium]
MKYVADKDKKALAADLKLIYGASSEAKAQEKLNRVTEKWQEKYPNAIESLNFDVSETQSPAQCISERYSPFKGSIPSNLRGNQKVEYANSKLGQGLWRNVHHV